MIHEAHKVLNIFGVRLLVKVGGFFVVGVTVRS